MKKLLRFIASVILAAGVSGLMACSPGDEGQDNASYSISFAQNPVMVGDGSDSYAVNVTATHQWNASPVDTWITNVTSSGSESATLSFTVAKNELETYRDGAILLSIPGTSYTQTLTVRQSASAGGITFDPAAVVLSTVGGAQTVTVNARNNWTVDTVSDDWITAERKNNGALTLRAEPNYTGAGLSGSVTLRDSEDNRVYTINVTQEYDGALFFNASTTMGRRFAHLSGQVYTITSERQYSIDDNVEALEIAYLGMATGTIAPYSLFVFDVTLGNGITIASTVPGDDDASIKTTELEETKKEIMREQLAAMQNNRPSVKVLAGVNGDFFFGTAANMRNNLLHGVIHRKGECLKSTFDGGAACTVFAVMKDGAARCMTQSQYAADKNEIYEAIGGRQQLLSSATAVSADATLEPRTAVGVSRDGKRVTILIVDGRRDTYSVGASYAMMAKMFSAFGAWDAINLDGGGSSTFAVRSVESAPVTSDSFETRNRPVDNTGDREVVNGLAIIKTN